MLNIRLLFVLSCVFNIVAAQRPEFGTIDSLSIPSKWVGERTVSIWLPPNYPQDAPYAVVIMHDGQNIFDARFSAYSHAEWKADEAAMSGMQNGDLPPTILVGIWSKPDTRHGDYFPQSPFETLDSLTQKSIFSCLRSNGAPYFPIQHIQSDAYLDFIEFELLPHVHNHYQCSDQVSQHIIGGSSMGGLISWYALSERPHLFGGAFCLSTHWTGVMDFEGNPIPGTFLTYLKTHIPDPKNHKLYFDYGTESIDAWYEKYQLPVDVMMTESGFNQHHYRSLKFEGHTHSETDWAKRLPHALSFLLKP